MDRNASPACAGIGCRHGPESAHYVTLIEPWLPTYSWTWNTAVILRGLGNYGVDLFFVLSGYLIYGMLIAKPRRFWPYFARRIQRIYPAFLVVFAIYLVLSWLMPAVSKIPGKPAEAIIYLVQNVLLLPGLFSVPPLITVAWSLSYEMFYYLAIPLIIALLGLRSWPRSLRMLLFFVIAVVSFVYCALFGGPVRLTMFVAGILLYDALESRSGPILDLTGLAVLVIGLIAVAMMQRHDEWGVPRLMILFVAFFVLCYACFCANGVTSRIFCWTPIRWLGNMSYSYYLLHGLTLRVAFEGLESVYQSSAQEAWMFWIMLPPMFLASLLTTGILFVAIERPYSLLVARPAPEGRTGAGTRPAS